MNHVLAVGLGIGGVGEEHAFVASSLFILADTAWLYEWSDGVVRRLLCSVGTFAFAAASPLGLRSAARLLVLAVVDDAGID